MPSSLDTPVQYLKGVGPRLGEVLSRRGIFTIGDLLRTYPRSYEDRRVARTISSLKPNEIVSLKAQIVKVSAYAPGGMKRKIYDISVRDQSSIIHCKFFRTPYKGYFERFQPGQMIRVVGKVTLYRNQIEFHHPDLRDVEEGEEEVDQLVPIYIETEGLNPRKFRQITAAALAKVKELEISAREKNETYGEIDPLPEWLRKKYALKNLRDALSGVHHPPRESGPEFASFSSPFHQRIIFEEFFWLELYLALKKHGWQSEAGTAILSTGALAAKLASHLPFALTEGQQSALSEIVADLRKSSPMHRLVQGDVGCGKTLVAMLSASHVMEAGFQSALMVPTEILAEQHYRNAVALFTPLGKKVGLLTGQVKTRERQLVLQQLASGETDLCVGTHALIQDDVDFARLGLVIIDEQHRFGVQQRSRLKNKGMSPHFLIMTATPIPRTLAMTVYGDLDVSLIKELPKGRSPVVTRVTYDKRWPDVMKFLREQISKGRQGYLVYPLVEESETMDLKDAMSAFAELSAQNTDIRFALLHGKMKSDEKEEVMRQFRAGQFQVLVSTTVIEVGVDVPNANIMIIQHAERFGLSQLHQLRGRVGRGSHKSYCVLVLGHAVSHESRERTQIMEQTTDGFKVAEADLEIRGPGEFLGAKQSGLPGFRMANLIRDIEILQAARKAAFEVVAADPELTRQDNAALRSELENQHGSAALASVG